MSSYIKKLNDANISDQEVFKRIFDGLALYRATIQHDLAIDDKIIKDYTQILNQKLADREVNTRKLVSIELTCKQLELYVHRHANRMIN